MELLHLMPAAATANRNAVLTVEGIKLQEALTCWGYMQGMQDLSVLADENGRRIMGACPPEQMTTLQLIRLFIRYASTHRNEIPGNAVVAVFRALGEAYPCRAEHGD